MKMISTSPVIYISVIFVLITLEANPTLGQDSSGFAEYLFRQKDYFRAITVFKGLLFESKEKAASYRYSRQIAEAYRLSGKYKSSIYFYSESLRNVSKPHEHVKSLIGLGLNYYHLKTIPLAKSYFQKAADVDTTGHAELFLGLMAMEKMNWPEAQIMFKNTLNKSKNPEVLKTADLLSQKADSGKRLPKKSPALAFIMSSILPGSGQIYSGHFFDGVQAFTYIGAFSLATYSAYRYDRDVKDSDGFLLLSAVITGIFYLSNVFGAHQTAKFRNVRIRQDFMAEAQKAVFEVSF